MTGNDKFNVESASIADVEIRFAQGLVFMRRKILITTDWLRDMTWGKNMRCDWLICASACDNPSQSQAIKVRGYRPQPRQGEKKKTTELLGL